MIEYGPSMSLLIAFHREGTRTGGKERDEKSKETRQTLLARSSPLPLHLLATHRFEGA